jgi:hypothetical protein
VLESFTCSTFRPLVGDVFRLDAEGEPVDLELREAAEAGSPADPRGRAPFSIEFLGPPEPVLVQRIYALSHPVLDSFDLFLVPLGPEGGRMRYEAVFT